MINCALCKTSHPISALTLGSSILLDLAILSPNQKWLLWIKALLLPSLLLQNENKVVSQQCNQGEPDVVSCHPAAEHSWIQTHTCRCGTAPTASAWAQKLPTRSCLQPLWFYCGWISCRFVRSLVIYSPSSFQERISIFQEQPRSAASGAAPLQALWREEWGNQCYSSKVIRQPQITALEEMSGLECTTGFVQGFFLAVLEFLWANMKLFPLWKLRDAVEGEVKADSAFS